MASVGFATYASVADCGATSVMAIQAHMTVSTAANACKNSLPWCHFIPFMYASPWQQASPLSAPTLGVNCLQHERSLATCSHLSIYTAFFVSLLRLYKRFSSSYLDWHTPDEVQSTQHLKCHFNNNEVLYLAYSIHVQIG